MCTVYKPEKEKEKKRKKNTTCYKTKFTTASVACTYTCTCNQISTSCDWPAHYYSESNHVVCIIIHFTVCARHYTYQLSSLHHGPYIGRGLCDNCHNNSFPQRVCMFCCLFTSVMIAVCLASLMDVCTRLVPPSQNPWFMDLDPEPSLLTPCPPSGGISVPHTLPSCPPLSCLLCN